MLQNVESFMVSHFLSHQKPIDVEVMITVINHDGESFCLRSPMVDDIKKTINFVLVAVVQLDYSRTMSYMSYTFFHLGKTA